TRLTGRGLWVDCFCFGLSPGKVAAMFLILTLMLIFLVILCWIVRRSVAALEEKYWPTTTEAEQRGLKQILPGHGTYGYARVDAAEMATRQFWLGQLVQKRDRLEDKHASWLAFADKFNGFVNRLREWKGRKLPYTMGVLDVSGALYLIDYFGVGQYINFQN